MELLGGGTAADVKRLLGSSHCYVQPSVVTGTGKMEGIPVALMEALLEGLPAIASAISGIPELVREGDTGYLVEPADARALADAIERCYANPTEAAARGRRGRDLVLREYNSDLNLERLAALFEGGSVSALPRADDTERAGEDQQVESR